MRKTAYDIEYAVCMNGDEYEVPGQRGLDGDLRRLGIADFTHHDLVRVVAQNRAQTPHKGESFFFIHGYLQDSGQLIFDRIFDSYDFVVACVDFGNGRVECRGFAASGRTRDEQHAVRLRAEAPQACHGWLIETQVIECQPIDVIGQRLPVKNTQNRIFAKNAGHDGYAEIDLAS